MTPPRRLRFAIAGLLLALFAIAGCGKKGPLYLPPDSPPPAAPAAPAP
ncbi:MAG: lipoprotein [Pseudomonadota bacterium]